MPINHIQDENKEEISLYFHIPFCTRKCSYCHFYVIPDKEIFKKQLMQGLRLEWDLWLPRILDKKVVSVYFGGGTPALFGAPAIAEILSWIKRDRSVEVTLEANPENVTKELMQDYAAAGINRVSIGIQTFDANLLQKLNRLHDPQRAIKAIYDTAEAGINNISIDLMYDLPGQTLESWTSTLAQVESLPITHLSLYNLTIEPHTLFFKYRDSIEKQMPDAEISLEMYQKACTVLTTYGFQQYEISAFAKQNLISKHNVGYWIGRSFLGFGPSAFSYWNGKRFRNVANLSQYTKRLLAHESPVDFEEELSKDEQRCELLAIRLRLLEGVNLSEFEKKHGLLDSDTKKACLELIENGFLNKTENTISLSPKGILFYDTVATEIIK